jgi:hypothetical protein
MAVAAAPRWQHGRRLGRPSFGRPEGSRTGESQAHPRNDPDSSAAALHMNDSNHTCHLPDVIFSSLLCLLHAPSLFTFLTPPEPPSKIGSTMQAGSVKDLSPQRGVRSIVVRLAQIWENRNKEKELYELGLLFLDQEVPLYHQRNFSTVFIVCTYSAYSSQICRLCVTF